MAKDESGAFRLVDAGLTIALDVACRQALALATDDAGMTLTQYVYLYDCQEVRFDELPGADEGSFPVPRFAAAEVPVQPSPGAPSVGTQKVRKSSTIRHTSSQVLVRTPAVAWLRERVEMTLGVYDPITRAYAGREERLEIPRGRAIYLYSDRGEGMCVLGDGTRLFDADCSGLSKIMSEPFASLGPQPIEASWWLRLAGTPERWIDARPAHVDVSKRQSQEF